MRYIATLCLSLCFSLQAMDKAFFVSKSMAEVQTVQQATNSGISLGPYFNVSCNFTLNNRHVIQSNIVKNTVSGGLSGQDSLYHTYVSLQAEGNIKALQKELQQVEIKINSSQFFKMRYEKKQVVTLKHILSQPAMKLLDTIYHGSIKQACIAYSKLQQMFEMEEAARSKGNYTVTPLQLEAGKKALFTRADYSTDMYHTTDRNRASMVDQSIAEISTFQSKKPLESAQISDVESPLDSTLDMNLTTPTDIDLYNQIIITNPKVDFQEYIKQINEFLTAIKDKVAEGSFNVAYFAKEFAQGTAEHLIHAGSHPVEFVQEFVEGNLQLMQKITDLYVRIYSMPEELYLSKQSEVSFHAEVACSAHEASAQLQKLSDVVSQMSRKEWAKVSSKFFADYIIFHAASKGINLARALPDQIKNSPILAHINEEIEFFAHRPKIATPEGFNIGVELFEASEASTSSRNAFKVANMKQLFEKNDFGKLLKKNSVKTNKRYDGKAIYRITKKTQLNHVKKGDHFYLDALHKDHLELFDRTGNFKVVINLDGQINIAKTKAAEVTGRNIRNLI